MKMANLLSRLFRSKATRETEARVEEAKVARAYDTGRQMANTIFSVIDAFHDEKFIPVAKEFKNTFNAAMATHHKDTTIAGAMELLRRVDSDIENLKAEAFEGVWNELGEWKYLSIEMGSKEDFDRYINQKFNAIGAALSKNATENTAYCLARISGHITDQMHGLTPEEAGRNARENKLGQFREN
jgi:hypothetical protein